MSILSKKPKIIETKTFSEIKGFTFSYTEPKEWGANTFEKANENEYIVYNQNWPINKISEIDPHIKITKEKNLGLDYLKGKDITYTNIINGDAPSKKAKKNPHSILYDSYLADWKYTVGDDYRPKPGEFDFLEFFGPDFKVKIEFIDHPDKETFAEEIIKSFKIT